MTRLIGIALAMTAASLSGSAVGQTADMRTYAGSAEVKALIAKARKEMKPNQVILVQPLLKLLPYKANLEYRTGPVPPAVHEVDAELFYVIKGSGTVTIGGTLDAQTRVNATNLTGRVLVGGTPQRVAVGDFFIIPENTPHGFNAVNGTLVMMSLHLPRPVGN